MYSNLHYEKIDFAELSLTLKSVEKTFSNYKFHIEYTNNSTQYYCIWSDAVFFITTTDKTYNKKVNGVYKQLFLPKVTDEFVISFDGLSGTIKEINISPVHNSDASGLASSADYYLPEQYSESVDVSSFKQTDYGPIIIGGVSIGVSAIIILSIIFGVVKKGGFIRTLGKILFILGGICALTGLVMFFISIISNMSSSSGNVSNPVIPWAIAGSGMIAAIIGFVLLLVGKNRKELKDKNE